MIRNTILCAALLAVAQPGGAPTPRSVTGTYAWTGRDHAGCTVKVAPAGRDRIRYDLDCNRGGPSYNQGSDAGELRLAGGVAVRKMARCELRFRFQGERLVVAQTGSDADCGFGAGVYAGGTYRRTSRRTPSFD